MLVEGFVLGLKISFSWSDYFLIRAKSFPLDHLFEIVSSSRRVLDLDSMVCWETDRSQTHPIWSFFFHWLVARCIALLLLFYLFKVVDENYTLPESKKLTLWLPADCCVFRHLGPAARHSADCWFDSSEMLDPCFVRCHVRMHEIWFSVPPVLKSAYHRQIVVLDRAG